MAKKLTPKERRSRDYEMAYRYYRLGEHYLDLACRYEISPRHVHRIVRRFSPDKLALPRRILLEEMLPGLNALFGMEYEGNGLQEP